MYNSNLGSLLLEATLALSAVVQQKRQHQQQQHPKQRQSFWDQRQMLL